MQADVPVADTAGQQERAPVGTYLSVQQSQARLEAYKQEIAVPPPRLPSMSRAQEQIDNLRRLTNSMRNIVPGTAAPSPSLRGDGNGRGAAARPEELIPHDREAFLLQLARHAVPDDELRQKYERMEAERPVASLHLSSLATPPSGDYKSFLQGKLDVFQSNRDRVQQLAELTPRSLVKQRRSLAAATGTPSSDFSPAGASSPHRRGDDDEEDEEEAKKRRDSENVRNLMETLSSTKTDDLMEKSIVMQASKQDVQGNLSLKRAVQLAMAAQHAQQIDEMKRTFEMRLNEAVRCAKLEGLAMGRREGSESCQKILDAQAAKIQELSANIDRLTVVAKDSFVQKESTLVKVTHLRGEKEKLVHHMRKFDAMDVDELVHNAALYEAERPYLYAKAFRTAPDFDSLAFGPKRFTLHAPTAPPSAAKDSGRSGSNSPSKRASSPDIRKDKGALERMYRRAARLQAVCEAQCRMLLATHDSDHASPPLQQHK